MSHPIIMNKLFSHDEFNSLYEFLNKCVEELEEALDDEEVNNSYNNAVSIINVSKLINLDDIDDNTIITIDIVISDSVEDVVEKIDNISEEEKKKKIDNGFTKKQYIALLENANNLINEIEDQEKDVKIIKKIIRKLTPVYELFQNETW